MNIIRMIGLVAMVGWLHSCEKNNAARQEEHPSSFVGKWRTVKKIYSNGIEDAYKEDDEIYYLEENGKLKREYRDHNAEMRNQQGEWKIISKKSTDGKNDTLYLIKRTPLFNGTFEERFRVVSKTDKEMTLEEGSWGFEKNEVLDRYHLVKIE